MKFNPFENSIDMLTVQAVLSGAILGVFVSNKPSMVGAVFLGLAAVFLVQAYRRVRR
jgi:hypothetical protein